MFPMEIYLNDKSMANILSLKEVAYSFRVTMDTKEYYTMVVQYSKDKAYLFKEFEKGLYYLDISNQKTHHTDD